MYEKEMNLFGIKKRTLMNHSRAHSIVLQVLTEKEEMEMDAYEKAHGTVIFNYNKDIKIKSDNILLYGEIDFNNKEDIRLLKRFKTEFCDDLSPSNWIYSNVDYETGKVISENLIFKGYSTCNPMTWFMYNYLLLGKPKRIILYRIETKLIKHDNRWTRNS